MKLSYGNEMNGERQKELGISTSYQKDFRCQLNSKEVYLLLILFVLGS